MPRTAVPVTAISRAGVAPATPTTGDPANNHVIQNDGSVVLLVKNTNSGSTVRNLTIHLDTKVDGQAPAPRTYALAAAASRYIGPFPTSEYGDALDVDVDNAELTIAAYHV